MSRAKTSYRCGNCDLASSKWAGRCSGCGEWNTVVEAPLGPRPSSAVLRFGQEFGPVRLGEVATSGGEVMPTGVEDLDRVLCGGLLKGSVTVLGGEPGIGKSTLMLQALATMISAGHSALLVSVEESSVQVRLRAARLGESLGQLWVVSDGSLDEIEEATRKLCPSVLVVDSIQMVYDPQVSAAPGTLAQVRACAQRLVGLAKASGTAVVMTGHVTKEGGLQGPKALEHLVDTVLSCEGDRHDDLRVLRASKHRFGPTDELGLMRMTASGLVGVGDASEMLLASHSPDVAGSAVVPVLEGGRILMVEVQALLASSAGVARRSAGGIDSARLALLLAVFERHIGFSTAQVDVFVSVAGGLKVKEPACDLALVVALASAATGIPVPAGIVIFGEVGLGGEVRGVPRAPRRLAEASRMGFKRAILPQATSVDPDWGGSEVIAVSRVAEAIDLLALRPVRAGGPRRMRAAAEPGGRQGRPPWPARAARAPIGSLRHAGG